MIDQKTIKITFPVSDLNTAPLSKVCCQDHNFSGVECSVWPLLSLWSLLAWSSRCCRDPGQTRPAALWLVCPGPPA